MAGMRKSMLLLVVLAVPAAGGAPETIDPAEIPAYRLLRPGLAAAGQPSPQALARLGEMGFRTVINLRTEKEGASAEAPVVEAQGLRYVWIPVTPDSFSMADVEAVQKVLVDPSAGPVLLHCASSNRVGAVWSVLQSKDGKGLDEALAAGRAAGLHSPALEAAVRRVLGVPETVAPAPANP
jgi:uncharacterized protein (TIGR01244 family)